MENHRSWTEDRHCEEGAAATGCRQSRGIDRVRGSGRGASFPAGATRRSRALRTGHPSHTGAATGSTASASARPTSAWIKSSARCTHGWWGRKARLGLTNEDDLLETGIEVFVQPPGKRAQVLTLLSGGETAMVAIASSSLFRVKPSPFCLLDEVRLWTRSTVRLTVLAEMADLSQFIVITQ